MEQLLKKVHKNPRDEVVAVYSHIPEYSLWSAAPHKKLGVLLP
jgi:hypothetical protein